MLAVVSICSTSVSRSFTASFRLSQSALSLLLCCDVEFSIHNVVIRQTGDDFHSGNKVWTVGEDEIQYVALSSRFHRHLLEAMIMDDVDKCVV